MASSGGLKASLQSLLSREKEISQKQLELTEDVTLSSLNHSF